MRPERWRDVVDMIKDRFPVRDQQTDRDETTQPPTITERIEFVSPLGIMKFEWITKPVVIGKKTFGSHRIGDQAAVTYQYSDTESSHVLSMYRWDDATNDWQPLTSELAGSLLSK